MCMYIVGEHCILQMEVSVNVVNGKLRKKQFLTPLLVFAI
jgi:hypothetical protein